MHANKDKTEKHYVFEVAYLNLLTHVLSTHVIGLSFVKKVDSAKSEKEMEPRGGSSYFHENRRVPILGIHSLMKEEIRVLTLPIILIVASFGITRKRRDLTQSNDKSLYTNRNKKNKVTTQKRQLNISITQQLWTDLRLSVGVITTTQQVWLKGLRVQHSNFP